MVETSEQLRDNGAWVIEPVTRCVRLLVEETKNAKLIQNALKAFIHVGPLLRQHYKRQPSPKLRAIIAEHEAFSGWAQELEAHDFHEVNAHGVIGLWVAVEVAIEDTAVLILTKDTEAVMCDLACGGFKKLPPRVAGEVLTDEDAHALYTRLERQSRDHRKGGETPGRSAADAYCYLLSLFGINITLDPQMAAIVSELNYVRNCLLHRGGIADERAASEAPELRLRPGDKIALGSDRYLRYYQAVAAFAQALLKGAFESRHIRLSGSDSRS